MKKPRSLPEEYVEVRTGANLEVTRFAVAVLPEIGWDSVEPCRKPGAYRTQRHYSGLYWSVTAGRLVWHESLMERQFLIVTDLRADVDLVVAQPFKLVWTVDDSPRRKRRLYTPDYLVRYPSGELEAVAVKSPAGAYSGIDQLLRAREVLAQVDIPLTLWHGSEAEPTNLELLSAFRRGTTELDALTDARLPKLETPFSLHWLYRQQDPDLVAAVWRGIALGRLQVDMHEPFSNSTVVDSL